MTMVSLSINAIHSDRLSPWKRLKAMIKEWRQRARSRYELTMLDDRQLSDVNLTRMDVHAEYEKPFWRR